MPSSPIAGVLATGKWPPDALGGTGMFADPQKKPEEKICVGVYLCEDCGKLHFLEAPSELQ
jgi:hypothetical protein